MNIKTMKDLLFLFVLIILGWLLVEKNEMYKMERRDNTLQELQLELTRDSLKIYKQHYDTNIMPVVEFQDKWRERLNEHYKKVERLKR